MTHALTVEHPGAAAHRCTLEAPMTAGGSRADGIHLPGAPAAALRLVPASAGVVVEAATSGVRVGGRPLAPGERRLLRPSERAEVGGAALTLERAAAQPGTRVAAAALLRDAVAGAPPAPGARLVVLSGPRAGACHALGPDQTIGRARRADVRVPDPHASRVHARVRLDAHGATIEDLGSKNGVFVNGVRIERSPTPLSSSDEISIGETSLAVEDPSEAPTPETDGAAPPPDRAARSRVSRPAAAALLLAFSAAALALAVL